MATEHGPEWLSVEQIAFRFSVSAATVWRWTRDGRFPKPIKVGGRSTRWRRADVEEHENKLAHATA